MVLAHADGMPPRSEDREALKRMAPELFGPNSSNELDFGYDFKGRFWDGSAFRQEVKNWLQTKEDRPLVTIRDGTCPQQDCPLRLAGRPGQIMSGRCDADDGSIVIQVMTVAGGWKAKADAFFDMARKVHGGKGRIKDISCPPVCTRRLRAVTCRSGSAPVSVIGKNWLRMIDIA
ncbi:hypothetical protein [Mesorhizobium sp. LSHC412B00]|uniref:hypothetical protein n=1 Tax=Mesorhizobium sp. LSHC412B00 TaxID=1287285 RepID=UPI0003CDD8BA|nr:hypothetical protein [Mesorhizobium sp. LSHC412B00]ESX91385.1 hypothetical protein X756_04480 [Mesorhizobium sp. LSHC412B00]